MYVSTCEYPKPYTLILYKNQSKYSTTWRTYGRQSERHMAQMGLLTSDRFEGLGSGTWILRL